MTNNLAVYDYFKQGYLSCPLIVFYNLSIFQHENLQKPYSFSVNCYQFPGNSTIEITFNRY